MAEFAWGFAAGLFAASLARARSIRWRDRIIEMLRTAAREKGDD